MKVPESFKTKGVENFHLTSHFQLENGKKSISFLDFYCFSVASGVDQS